MLNHKGKKVKVSLFGGVVIVSNSNMHVIATQEEQHDKHNSPYAVFKFSSLQ